MFKHLVSISNKCPLRYTAFHDWARIACQISNMQMLTPFSPQWISLMLIQLIIPRFSWPNNHKKLDATMLDHYFMVNYSFDFDSGLCKIEILESSFGAHTKRAFLKLFWSLAETNTWTRVMWGQGTCWNTLCRFLINARWDIQLFMIELRLHAKLPICKCWRHFLHNEYLLC